MKEVAGGKYVYLGIAPSLQRYIDNIDEKPKVLSLNFNIDGIPLFHSNGTQLWPILASVNRSPPFAVAHWVGASKPSNVTVYLHDLIRELDHMQANDFVHNEQVYKINVKAFICDAPARSFLKCIIGHTGYYACERCEVEGVHFGSVRMQETDAELHTNERFAAQDYDDHQRGESPLASIHIPMVTSFVLDYMHLVCLGVMRRMVAKWKKGEFKLTPLSLAQISSNLIKMRENVPSCFQRRPRGLDETEYWKATEWRFFLLYGGIVALKNNIPHHQYKHFLALSMGMRILLSKVAVQDPVNVAYAKSLLTWFVKESIQIYGAEFITYNVHNMIHIADDVSNHQVPLDEISSFPFESYLGKLKRLIHGAVCPIRQLVKRLDELDHANLTAKSTNNVFRPSNKVRDRVFLLEGGKFGLVEEVYKDGSACCTVLNEDRCSNYFDFPSPSSNFDICHILSGSHGTRMRISSKRLCHQALMLPVTSDVGGFVLLPMVHEVN